jgi:signal transduction histidine kinase
VAQDVAPAPRGFAQARPLQQVVGLLQRAHLLPPSATPGRVALTRPLVTYVAVVATVSVLVAALTITRISWYSDGWALAVGTIATFLMAVYAVRSLPQSTFVWSPSVFVNLGLSVTLGPIGAASSAIGEALGVASRTRNGWFRTIFNVSNHFLSNVSAWAAFAAVRSLAPELKAPVGAVSLPGAVVLLVAGLAAGVTQYAVNHTLMNAVIRISNPSVDLGRVIRNSLSVLPYSVGYGLAAFTFVAMVQGQGFGRKGFGAIGLMGVLIPIILLQGYLVLFGRRMQAHEEERAAHQKEREELLQRAVEASEAERRRIARDLHDGVVQNLAGMAFALSAEASSLKAQAGEANGSAEMLELLETSASETRGAMKDLRTLIIELAPPTLRREGLQAALLEVLRDIKKKGTNTELDLPPNLRLREDRGALIFRVAHEILRNVAAHAQAKNVKVELTTEDGSAILAIQDDGKGFSKEDADRRRAEGHLGTAAIVELAEEAGGTLTIDSEPGRGTLVVLTLPIE